MYSSKDQKENLLKFLYDVFRLVENNELTGADFSIKRGTIETYEGLRPSGDHSINIHFTTLPKVKSE